MQSADTIKIATLNMQHLFHGGNEEIFHEVLKLIPAMRPDFNCLQELLHHQDTNRDYQLIRAFKSELNQVGYDLVTIEHGAPFNIAYNKRKFEAPHEISSIDFDHRGHGVLFASLVSKETGEEIKIGSVHQVGGTKFRKRGKLLQYLLQDDTVHLAGDFNPLLPWELWHIDRVIGTGVVDETEDLREAIRSGHQYNIERCEFFKLRNKPGKEDTVFRSVLKSFGFKDSAEVVKLALNTIGMNYKDGLDLVIPARGWKLTGDKEVHLPDNSDHPLFAVTLINQVLNRWV